MSRLKNVEPVMVACALFGSLIPACHAQAGPQERAWNIEQVGAATLGDGKPDLIAYSGADTYDVVLGPKGYLYVTDGTAGMRVLKYTGPVSPAQ